MRNNFPSDDNFEDTTIAAVRPEAKGWSIERADGYYSESVDFYRE